MQSKLDHLRSFALKLEFRVSEGFLRDALNEQFARMRSEQVMAKRPSRIVFGNIEQEYFDFEFELNIFCNKYKLKPELNPQQREYLFSAVDN